MAVLIEVSPLPNLGQADIFKNKRHHMSNMQLSSVLWSEDSFNFEASKESSDPTSKCWVIEPDP